MKILQIVSNMKKNGPAMMVYDLSFGLAALGHNIYIASAYGQLAEELIHPNIHYIKIPINRVYDNEIKKIILYLKNGIKTYSTLSSLIEEEKIDIINSHQPVPNLFARILSKKFNIPFITTSHNIYRNGFFSNTYVSGDHVVACSEKVYENSIKNFGVSKDRISCIRNGINPSRLRVTEPLRYPKQFVIGTLSGLRKQKSLNNLIMSFYKFHSMIEESCLIIAGEGEEEKKLKELVDKLNMKDSVIFLGFRNDTANVLYNLDIFALSSEYEGLPISMLEAMAMKKPLVVTSVGGIPWIIKDGENGILCEYGNVENMFKAFLRLYNDREFSSQLGNAGYKSIVEELSNIKMAESYLSVYDRMIRDRKKNL